MTDWTTPEDVPEVVRERLHQWLKAGHPAQATTLANFAVSEVIRAFWPAPARTLAVDLADITEHWEEWATDTIIEELTAATTRAKQVENDLAEARAEVKRERDLGHALAHERDDTRAELERVRSELTEVTHARDSLREDYDHARAEVERLTAERDRLEAAQYLSDGSAWGGPVREPTVQKGAETTAETPTPADVPAGEAWLMECRGERRNAVKDRERGLSWNTVNDDGWFVAEGNGDVTLIARLVPAPRTITNPDDLDRLAEGAVVLSLSTQYALQRVNAGDGWYCPATKGKATSHEVLSCGPVTVLWEPEA